MSETRKHRLLTLEEEMEMLLLILRDFPIAFDVRYLYEVPSDDPGSKAFSWTFNCHLTYSFQPDWGQGELHIRQRLTVDGKTRETSFPLQWGGFTRNFDEKGEATIDGNAAHEFWRALIEHDGQGVPIPESKSNA